MVKIAITIIVFYCTFLITSPTQAQQSQQAMQQQEAAADSQVSSSGTAVAYPTPYKLFQAYYAGLSGSSSAAMYACFTPTALSNAFDGTPPTTQASFAAMDAGRAQRNPQNFVLESFVFTPNPTTPKITTIFTFTVLDPQNSAQRRIIQSTDNLTLIDTPQGWMINVYQEQ
jgi:hypothetical protein